MSDQPDLSQFFGKTPQIPPDGQAADPKLDFSIPSPFEAPDLWDTVVLTLASDSTVRFELPPKGMGWCEIVVPPAVKLDSKGGAGKAKPRSTKTGGEAMKEKITVNAIDEAWPFILAAARQIVPGSGPWNIYHPKADVAGLTQIEIEKWTDAPSFEPDKGFLIKWEFHYSEIKPAAQDGAGGGSATDTPWEAGSAADGKNAKTQKAVDPNNQFQPVQDGAKKP